MIVNSGTFQAIILDKKKNNHTQEIIKIDKNSVKVNSSVKLLDVQIDTELNFNLQIANICRSAANQPNALIRPNKFFGFEEKKISEEILKISENFCMELNGLKYLSLYRDF